MTSALLVTTNAMLAAANSFYKAHYAATLNLTCIYTLPITTHAGVLQLYPVHVQDQPQSITTMSANLSANLGSTVPGCNNFLAVLTPPDGSDVTYFLRYGFAL